MNTLNFYNSQSKELIKRYDNVDMSKLHKLFLQYIKPESTILDIGFGSGRDLQFLKESNYDIWGIDPSSKFVQNIQTKFSDISNHFIVNKVPFSTNKMPFKIKFDAIITIAMWMHLKKEQYENVINDIVRMTTNKASVIISYSKGKRSKDQRYFEDVDLDYIIQLFSQHNFTLIKTTSTQDSLNRDTLTWITIIFKHD
jgi:cyclopropane fatty-acyl-phospholipid synthase-like methyltransferase